MQPTKREESGLPRHHNIGILQRLVISYVDMPKSHLDSDVVAWLRLNLWCGCIADAAAAVDPRHWRVWKHDALHGVRAASEAGIIALGCPLDQHLR